MRFGKPRRRSPFVRADEISAHTEWFSRELRYALGVDEISGRHFVSFPVSNPYADYEEYYEVDDDTYARYLANPALALPFVQECRKREHDNLLMVRPGRLRGWAGS